MVLVVAHGGEVVLRQTGCNTEHRNGAVKLGRGAGDAVTKSRRVLSHTKTARTVELRATSR